LVLFADGSGVIPNKFKEIRRTVKDAIMITFFDPEFLQVGLSVANGRARFC